MSAMNENTQLISDWIKKENIRSRQKRRLTQLMKFVTLKKLLMHLDFCIKSH